jgi:ATP-binding protein involved in chromosome partitioning
MNKESILNALRSVKDPNSGLDIVRAGMVQAITIEENQVNFTLLLPSLNMPNKAELNFACIGAVQTAFPMANVNVHTMQQTANAANSNSPIPHVRNIIAVGSGKGGVGKSTVAVNLALALQELGAKVGLLDADIYGPSMPTMLGLHDKRPKVQDSYGKPKLVPIEVFGMQVMSLGFIINPDDAVVLRGPRLAAIIKQFFFDTLWEPLDFLIVDLPPGTGDVQLSLVQTVPVTGAVIVTTPQDVALADAIRAVSMFRLPNIDVPILGVVENMSWFTPEELPDSKYYIFGKDGGKKLAKSAQTMLLGQIPLVMGIREASDLGKPIVLHNEPITKRAFMHVAENVARQVAIRNETIEPTRMVKVN